MPTLYEMTQDYDRVLNMLYDPEIPEQAIFDTLELLDTEIETKADSYAKLIRELEVSVETVKAEAARLTERKRSLESKAKALKSNLQEAMLAVGRPKIKTALFSFSVQSNPTKVEINDLQAVLKNRRFIKARKLSEDDVDKTAIKAALEAGCNIKGAQLVQGQSLRIR